MYYKQFFSNNFSFFNLLLYRYIKISTQVNDIAIITLDSPFSDIEIICAYCVTSWLSKNLVIPVSHSNRIWTYIENPGGRWVERERI